MNWFLFDASSLVKRFAPEPSTTLVNDIFARAGSPQMGCLMLGAAEVVAALVRKRNSRRINQQLFIAAMLQLKSEVLDVAEFTKLPVDNGAISRAIPLIGKHSINSHDAVLLQTGLELDAHLRSTGDALVRIVSDHRLLRASHSEGLSTFDPESQDQATLDALLAVK